MANTYRPFKGMFSVTVTHTPFHTRNPWGWDCQDFWNPITAMKFAKAEAAKPENAWASVYFRWKPQMKCKTICRVLKTGVVREFPK